MSITVDCNHPSPRLATGGELQGATGCVINNLVLFLGTEGGGGYGHSANRVNSLNRVDRLMHGLSHGASKQGC